MWAHMSACTELQFSPFLWIFLNCSSLLFHPFKVPFSFAYWTRQKQNRSWVILLSSVKLYSTFPSRLCACLILILLTSHGLKFFSVVLMLFSNFSSFWNFPSLTPFYRSTGPAIYSANLWSTHSNGGRKTINSITRRIISHVISIEGK